MAQNYVKALTLSTFAASSLSTSYQAVNSAGFSEPVFFMRLVNDTNQDVTISYDGVNDNEYVAAGDTFEFPNQANSQPQAQLALWRKGTVVYVKAAASGTGTLTLSGYYQ